MGEIMKTVLPWIVLSIFAGVFCAYTSGKNNR